MKKPAKPAKSGGESADARLARLEEHALAAVATTEDPDKLRRLREAGRREGSPRVEDAAFRRLVAILPGADPDADPGSVEHEFWRTIHAFEALLGDERGKTMRLTRTRQKIARVGEVRTLADFATARDATSGFEMLVERGLPELTGEAIILRHRARFEPDVVAAAEARLGDAGIDLALLPESA